MTTPTSPTNATGSAPVDVRRVVRHASFDADGYPTEETLETIKAWPDDDLPALIVYVREAWSHYGRNWEENGEIKMATGGWSGNEEIMSALRENVTFWAMCWQSSHRGGLACFRMPDAEVANAGPTRIVVRAQCRVKSCSHVWEVAHLPMDLRAFAKVLKRAMCPKCGDARPNLNNESKNQEE